MAESEKAQDKLAPMQEAEHDAEDIGDVVSLSHLHRTLDNRQIQLIAIGGSIGTGLFVSIGYGLIEGGPGSLFIAFTMYSIWLAAVNNSMAEMATFMPVAGGWVCKILLRSSLVAIRTSSRSRRSLMLSKLTFDLRSRSEWDPVGLMRPLVSCSAGTLCYTSYA